MTTAIEETQAVQETPVVVEEREPTFYETYFAENPLGVLELDTDVIGIRPEDNGRVVTAQAGDKSLKAFQTDIEAKGQQQPIKIRLINGLPFVGFGFRRYMACKALGRTVLCMLMANESEDSDDLDAFSKNASENIQREALGAMDMLRIFERMSAKVEDGGFALSQKEIGDRCGVSRSLVNVYLNNLSPLSQKSKDLIRAEKVSASAAIELMSSKTMTPEQVDSELLKLAEGTAEGKKGGSVRDVRKKTRKAAEEKVGSAKKQRTTKEIVADLEEEVAGDVKGVKVVKAALLKYVKGGMSFDTFVKKIAEVV